MSRKTDVDFIVGVDEVGRGAWAGPIVGAAVAWPATGEPSIPENIRIQDSKTLTEHQREKAGAFLRSQFMYSVFSVSVESILCSGIQDANRRCLEGAIKKIERLLKKKANKILIDGRPIFSLRAIEYEFIVRGDAEVKAIGAASIIAKTYRDAQMRRMSRKYPEYGFERNKGYGTKEHYGKLLEHGLCALHRRNFEPMRSLGFKGFKV